MAHLNYEATVNQSVMFPIMSLAFSPVAYPEVNLTSSRVMVIFF